MAVTLPYTFTSGTTIRSSEVNANFDSLNNRTQWVTPEMFGAVGDGVTDDTVAFDATISYAIDNKTEIHLSKHYKIGSTLHIPIGSKVNLKIKGVGTPIANSSVSLRFYGTGALFEIGEYNADEETTALYNGNYGFQISDVALSSKGTTGATDLLNGCVLPGTSTKRQYVAGTYGIKDHCGGQMKIERCSFANFNYGIWGVQSPFNQISDCQFHYNSVGVHLGYRSEQGTLHDCISSYNDKALELDAAWSTVVNHWTTNGDGSDSTSPFDVYSTGSRGQSAVVFNDCWFEHYSTTSAGGNDSIIVPSFISCGETGAGVVRSVIVKNPTILTNVSTTLPKTRSLISFDKSSYHIIDNVLGRGDATAIGLDKLIISNSSDLTGALPGHFYVNFIKQYVLWDNIYVKEGTGSYPPQVFFSSIYNGLQYDPATKAVVYNIDPDTSTSGVTNPEVRARLFRHSDTGTAASSFDILKADGTSSIQHRLDAKGNIIAGHGGLGAWNEGHIQLGGYHLWVDAAGKLRIKSTTPTSDTDGTIVGTQTA